MTSPVYGSLREKIAAESAARKARYASFDAIVKEAHEAGIAAGKAAIPEPMIVSQHTNPLNDASPVTKSWYVSEGACGFAWINVRPANSSFGIWAKKNDKGWSRHYYGGIAKYVHEFGQSITRKEAYAHAYAEVLSKHGIKAHAGSRLD